MPAALIVTKMPWVSVLRFCRSRIASYGIQTTGRLRLQGAGPQSRSVIVKVLQGTATSWTVTSPSVVGGSNVTVVLKLSAKAGPAGTTFNLVSSDPVHAPVPASVTVLPGGLQIGFVVHTTNVGMGNSVNITITATGSSTVGTLMPMFTVHNP